MRLSASERELAGYLEQARTDSIRRHASAPEEDDDPDLRAKVTVTAEGGTSYTVTMDFDKDGVLDAPRTILLQTGVSFNGNENTVAFDWRGRTVGEISIGLINEMGDTSNINITGSGDITLDTDVFQDNDIPNVTLNNSSVSGDVIVDNQVIDGVAEGSVIPTETPNTSTPTPTVTPTPTPTPSPTRTPTPTPTPCSMSVSSNSVSLPNNGGTTINVTMNNLTGSTLKITFLGSTAKVDGTSFALCGTCNPLALNHPNVSGGVTSMTSTVTAPQPKRVIVRSTGYGPKGSVKRLEMLVNRSSFMLEVPGVLILRGSDDTSNVAFDIGSSNAQTYSGADHANVEARLPTFVVSGKDVSTTNAGISKHGTVDDPEIAYLDNGTLPSTNTVSAIVSQTPEFLRTANNARAALDALQATASSMNRYFKPAAGQSYTVSSSNTTATGITFVDGNCNLDGGSGLLVVTGNLQTNGNPSFSGVVLVLGTGTVSRSGNGNGAFYGAVVVAGFPRTGNGGFTAPSFNVNGGGNGTLQYDSVAVSRAFGAIGAVSAGVREF